MQLIRRLFVAVVVLVSSAVFVGILYEWSARTRAASRYPAPGRLVEVGGRTLHLDCRGAGAPTVIFEAGLDANGSLAWSAVHDSVAAQTRACAYDRAGMMWSGPVERGEVRDARAVATDLSRLLEAAGEAGPYVLVGHSLGGPYALVLTDALGDEVAGLVLVDPSHPDQVERLRPATGDLMDRAKRMMTTAQVLATVGAVRLFMSPSPEQFPGFPPAQLEVAAALQPRGFRAVAAEAAAMEQSMAEASEATDLGDRPIVVLTALRPVTEAERDQMGLTGEQGVALKAIWDTLQTEWAAFSSAGRQVRLPDAGHYVQFDRPDAVIAAVREVVDSVRARRAGTAP